MMLRTTLVNVWAFGLIAVLVLAGCAGETAVRDTTPASESTEPAAVGHRLLFRQVAAGQQSLIQYDLDTKAIEPLFTVPPNGWLAHADVAPDGSQFVLAYSPPPPAGKPQLGLTQLYLLVNGDETPRLLIEPTQPNDIYFSPDWSENGRFITYSHVTQPTNNQATITTLERYDLDTGESTIIAANGIWAKQSPDSSKIAYVIADLTAQTRQLIVANADGSNPAVLVTDADFADIDAPFFTPNNQWLYFSAVEHAQSTLWERLTGIQIAAAHNVPSDWWRISLDGDQLEQMTTIRETGIAGTVTGEQIAFVSQTGLFTMALDGSNLEKQLDIATGGFVAQLP